ncbi:hypothetical protein HmCmsJML030_03945 [Escherichia coli]|nr:hypothetical protein HmCmsJML030_03945 [Escherichia coli]
MKKAHTGECGLKWEAKDSNKLIGKKETEIRGHTSIIGTIQQT